MIAYRAVLDVPRELLQEVVRLLAAERHRLGTRRESRALTCWCQALMVLAWFCKREDVTVLAAGFGVPRATGYRYRGEGITVLQAAAPDLYEALERVAEQDWPHVVLDEEMFRSDRCAQATTSAKGVEIDAWYSGKHRAFGGNVQAVMRPDRFPVWVGEVAPGHNHDITAARAGSVFCALYWEASSSSCRPWPTAATKVLVTTFTPRSNSPATAGCSVPITQTYNVLHRATRVIGECGFALLTGRWRALQCITACPSRIGAIVAAGLVLARSNAAYAADLAGIFSMTAHRRRRRVWAWLVGAVTRRSRGRRWSRRAGRVLLP